MTELGFRYRAFISYSHRDQKVARWLHGALEAYRVPKRLIGKQTTTGTVTHRLGAIFRDRDELPVASDLSGKINEALAATQFLIVLCSPASARSKWVNQEVINFKRLKGEDSIIAIVVAGEPFASQKPGHESEECFVPALRFQVSTNGQLTDHPAEPIAADLRPDKDTKRLVKLKVVAGLLGLGLDELVRRENQRRTQRLFWLSVGMAAGMLTMAVLTVTAINSRNDAVIARDDAERQKTQAEDLIEFMLGDLRGKLQPVGRLDVLDSVGEKALAYFASLKPGEMDDDTQGRKARALHLLGEIQDLRGDADGALRAFREARDTTLSLMRDDPENEQRIFEHAQSEYWIGLEHFNKGQLAQAAESILSYKALANKLIRIDPKNIKWQKESGHAEINTGVIFLQQGRALEAVQAFENARTIFQKIADSNADDIETQTILAQCYAWFADANVIAGRLGVAERGRQDEVAIYDRLTLRDPQNKDLARARLVAYKALGELRLDSGNQASAINAFEVAATLAATLDKLDPENTLWREQSGRTALDLAEAHLEIGADESAANFLRKAQIIAEQLVKIDASTLNWQINLRGRALVLRARLAKSQADREASLRSLYELLQYLDNLSDEQRATADVNKLVPKVLLVAGDLEKSLGDSSAANNLWRRATDFLSKQGDKIAAPSKVDLAVLYQKLEKADQARALAREVILNGYTSPRVLRIVKQD